MGANTGETLQERSKGKDVRTSNIVAAKVRRGFGDRYLWYRAVSRLEAGRITLAFFKFWPERLPGLAVGRRRCLDGELDGRLVPETFRPAAMVTEYCFQLIY